jgi:hypothetical protein
MEGLGDRKRENIEVVPQLGGKGKEEVRSHLATFFSLKWKDLEGKNGAVSNALFNVNNFIFFKKFGCIPSTKLFVLSLAVECVGVSC